MENVVYFYKWLFVNDKGEWEFFIFNKMCRVVEFYEKLNRYKKI